MLLGGDRFWAILFRDTLSHYKREEFNYPLRNAHNLGEMFKKMKNEAKAFLYPNSIVIQKDELGIIGALYWKF